MIRSMANLRNSYSRQLIKRRYICFSYSSQNLLAQELSHYSTTL